MEGKPEELPLKVCPHCSVASRTESDTCPSCGKSYVRGGGLKLQWSWWLAIPIVIAAFAIGYFGISKLIGGGESDDAVITAEQAQAVSNGATRAELDEAIDGEDPAYTDELAGKPKTTCLYYGLEDDPNGVWSFCFTGDKLISSSPAGAAAQPPAGTPVP
jgi:hypothetical protein